MPEIFNSSQSSNSQILTPEPQDDPAVETANDPEAENQLEQFQKGHPNRNPLSAFLAKPPNTFFDSQTHQECILLLLRQHPITQVKWVITSIVLLFIPFLFQYLPFIALLPSSYQFVITMGWYLLVFGFIFQVFLDWFFNVSIITDERVIDIEFLSLIFKHISYTQIEKIEDVTATTSGALGAVFDYGDVMIQTAAATDEFQFLKVPEPTEVAEFINQMLVEEEREQARSR